MHSYQAILMHPELPTGRCTGELFIDADTIQFSSEEMALREPLLSASISAGGAGERFIFFKFSQPDVTIYTSDRRVLKNAWLVHNPQFAHELKASGSRSGRLFTEGLIGLGILLLLGLGAYMAKDKVVEVLAKQIPVEWEKKAGNQLFAALTSDADIVKNDSLERVFLKVAAPLVAQVAKEGHQVDLYFVKDSQVNAYALPGGKVVVQTGLIDKARSWEEVMGVLSHELAHVTLRHHAQNIIGNVGIFVVLSAAVGDVSALAATFANLGGELASLANSRTFEEQADARAWEYMVAAGINPSGLTTFFESLQQQQAAKQARQDSSFSLPSMEFLSTHPDTKSRIEALKGREASLQQTFTPIENNFTLFKTALNHASNH